MVKICAIYVRKSKIDDNSDSMETQIYMCKEYINQKFPGCIVRIYDKDYGITGHSIKKRKDFQRMMEDVRNGLINVVAIQRYDRIARNTRDFCNIYHDMEKVGCELISVSQQIDTTTPYGKKFMYDQASMAELEWALNSERHKDTNRTARLGRRCALSPYALPMGYKAVRIDGIRKMVKDPETEHIINDAFQYLKECGNKNKTNRYINEKYNLNLSHSFVDRLVQSDFYHGQYREVMDYCPSYLTEEEHRAIRSRSSQYVRHYSNDKQYFIFTGKMICPVCGLKLESQSQKMKSGKQYYYYRCHNTYRTGLCDFKGNINEKYIESYLVENIQALIESDIADISVQQKNAKKVDTSKLKQELDRLNTMFLKGRIDESVYDSEYERIQKIISESELNTDSQITTNLPQIRTLFDGGWENTYNQLTRENKRQFWSEIIKEIHFNKDKTVKSVSFL